MASQRRGAASASSRASARPAPKPGSNPGSKPSAKPAPRPKAKPRAKAKVKSKSKDDQRHLRAVRIDERVPRSRAATNRRFQLLLLATTGLLCGVGLVMVLSASSVVSFAQSGSSFLVAWRQALYLVVGAGALVATAKMPFAAWRRLGFPFLLGCIALLVVVLHPAAGTVAGGSARWFDLGPVNVQPSEFAKLALIMVVAGVIVRRWDKRDQPMEILKPFLPVVVVVCILVMLQPDLGTTILISGTVFAMLFLAGLPLRWLTLAAISGVGMAMLMIFTADYRRERFLSFLNPWEDPQGSGFQLIQGLYALGSGGLTGVGLGASRQKWSYVPNAHTDFIFAILGEELGLIGAFGVIALFATLVYAGIRIAARAPDVFGRLLAGGIVAWFGIQALVNLGAVTGVLPITGVPLPFVSFGGSSLVVTLAAVGVLVSIARAGQDRGAGKAVARATR